MSPSSPTALSCPVVPSQVGHPHDSSCRFDCYRFMESSLGQLPSYTWRSIWATKGILEAGICWRIGSSTKILAIPLPFVPQKDVRAWNGESMGEYTVRSAYNWLIHNHYGISTNRVDDSPGFSDTMACFQAVLTGAQMGFLNVKVEGDFFFMIRNLKEKRGKTHINGAAHAFATNGLKRNKATYLVDDVPAYALDANEVDWR
ncbi:hypothetical protein J1N35_011164 [Gossypium stocksii]|uniref:RNase H type-1 domain-containing protein n=1 Tax=Gossypium stocksii TaxID=47602 RepID=A0A9D3W1Q4_9ROSI|nr:hypothetical protein J1N35_011164 [Gossypium stocksii]